MARIYLSSTCRDFLQAKDRLNQAVDKLRPGSRQDFIPYGLLARAEMHRLTGDYHHAQSELAEAQRIAERGEMGLHLADVHLEWARLCLAQGDHAQAREHWATAKEMIARMGYHRRDQDVAEIEQQLAGWEKTRQPS